MALALVRAGLPAEDIDEPGKLFWRFETSDNTLVGFGGLEPYPPHALLRSVVILPPMRRRGFGRAIVEALEVEAIVLKCRTVWLATTTADAFFAGLGYAVCDRDDVPQDILETRQLATLCPDTATVMTKAVR